MNNGIKIFFVIVIISLSAIINADETNNRGAINNLCRNLVMACSEGDMTSCQAANDTGCKCNESFEVCSRGNYSKE